MVNKVLCNEAANDTGSVETYHHKRFEFCLSERCAFIPVKPIEKEKSEGTK